MFATSYLEINSAALKKNLSLLKKLFGTNIKFSSVVKGNAYGHGIEAFVPEAEKYGIRHFSVFSADEALRVKNVVSKKSKIVIMGMIDDEDLEWAIKENIEFFVFDLGRLEAALAIAKRIRKKARIHIEFETGFNRTGFVKKSFPLVLNLFKKHKNNFILEGMCTHYAGAESIANYYRVQQQIKRFNSDCKWFADRGYIPKLKHTACSAAAISYPKTRMDMVRIGILQYGFWPSRETLLKYLEKQKEKHDPLLRLISWKSKIMSIKTIKTGEFVGYGTSYLAQRDTKIAVIPIGYAEGFSRVMSNLGRALVNGQRVSVIGIVNMNHLILDVTYLPNVKRNDEVVLIGDQEDLTISVSSFSELSDQLNYESLTRLPENIPRVVI